LKEENEREFVVFVMLLMVVFPPIAVAILVFAVVAEMGKIAIVANKKIREKRNAAKIKGGF
jgi:hypothetical protein